MEGRENSHPLKNDESSPGKPSPTNPCTVCNKEKSNNCECTFDMKQCSDALKEGNVTDKCEVSDNEEFTDAKDLLDEDAEYDDEFLKQLYGNMSVEQLEEFKEKSIALKNRGNAEYRSGHFSEAALLYTQALNSCPLQFIPERSILYANRAACYVSLEKNEEAVIDCNKALDLNPDYLKACIRRAQLHRKMENLDKCLEDYKKVLEMDKDNREARQACATLPAEINERNEKLKTEMLGKLKDLGNLVLRPFGLSTDNFNVVQDPNTGGYSVNFQK